ncbi:tryptophan halogenase family protein [Nonomuraea rubra]|uniref:Tryptophan halogenase n=1 Tax=Nonomuraea rubra TaxID=46180 RepID=A0A7X0TXC3_9ACTN|nr:tryptophan halogenase family protein [Nonomuraea rubra]MBB6547258.1 tryptophan halogenase [Nonomuraea rubra]
MMTSPSLEALAAGLPSEEAAAVRAWLGHGDALTPRPLAVGAEHLATGISRPRPGDDAAVRRVGVIGGGTAGYLTALALKAKRPWLEVTLVESPVVPIIGVGESTTPLMVTFLHHYLGVDPMDLYREVRPTWKLGIKFDWGPDPDGFAAPFDWDTNSVGIRGSLAAQGDINAATVQSLMMTAGRTPVFDVGGRIVSLMNHLAFSYHLDNGRFVAFLTKLAAERGVRHLAAQVADVELDERGWVSRLRTGDGQELDFDLYVDCSGFRSLLLGKALETPFHSYGSSLYTDSAVTGNVEHGGRLKPYTTARTMNAGWCWAIPTRESDHLGYVYASSALSDDDAANELAKRFPGVTEPKFVRFRSGRHAEAWRGNVMGIGNSYAFVEPLESSGLLMITWGIIALVNLMPSSWSEPCPRDLVNQALADRWDAIRWFLAIHYKFNTRLDTPFWKEVRAGADVTGMQPLLDLYASGAPLRLRDPLARGFADATSPTFYGLAGVDTILLGQKVPARLLPPAEPMARWHARKAAADVLVKHALPQHLALRAYDSEPRLHEELLRQHDSWARASVAGAVF